MTATVRTQADLRQDAEEIVKIETAPFVKLDVEKSNETVAAGGVPGAPEAEPKLPVEKTTEAGGVPGAPAESVEKAQDSTAAGGVPGAPDQAGQLDESLKIDEAGGVPGHEVSQQPELMKTSEHLQAGGVPGAPQFDEMDKLEQVAAGGVPGSGLEVMAGLDMFGKQVDGMTDFDPFAAGGVPGKDMDGGFINLSSMGDSRADDTGLQGMSGDGFGSNVDFSSYGHGGDAQQGWSGHLGSDDNMGSPYDFGTAGGSGSGSDSGNTGVPTGERPDTGFGHDDGSSNGGNTFTVITESSDFTDSNGNTHIENTVITHDHQNGTTMVDHTTHSSEDGTTQSVTVYDSDGNVVAEETSHEPPEDSGGASDSGGDAGSADAPADTGGEDGYTPADDYSNMGGSIEFTIGQPAIDGLIVPVEPGAGDYLWGAERVLQFGNGIHDPRTIYPADDDGSGDTSGGGSGGGMIGNDIVDPFDPFMLGIGLERDGQMAGNNLDTWDGMEF